MNYQNEISPLLKPLPHKQQVIFALYCARDVEHLVEDKDKQSVSKCLNTIDLWLKGQATKEEVKIANAATAYTTNAATAAATAAYAASTYVVAAATNASFYAATTTAAYAASAYIYTYAASTSFYASNAAYYAVLAHEDESKFKVYYDVLVKQINNLTDLEKVVYEIGSLV